jgi:hypothetical protein
MQGYHFPPPEPEPTYGYNTPPGGGQQQWGQPADPPGYELSYQAYNTDDPSPFHQATPHQQQGYGEQDGDYGEEYFEDEAPRRGRRWILITAALVGAIGVGGALAYTYRSLIAPNSSRVPVARSDAAAKARPDYRSAGAERKLPTRVEEPPMRVAPEPEPPREEPAADTANMGPRVVRPIPITPGGTATAPEPAPSVPGITLYRPPQMQQPQAPAVPPPAAPPSAAPAAMPAPQPPPQRVAIGSRPTASGTDEEPSPAASPPPARRPPVQTAAVMPHKPAAPARPREAASSAGLGYVAVLKSSKSSMEALQTFADMQQQYPDVLSDKTPDVQTADLSARGLGTMYRLVVGPPGSHNAARSVCTQLKTAGYEGCWVKEY